ncbi:MAG TPA: tetratricopeptide repeat protein, partial [Armatimonadaceae bacterium]|nr:tetratricopeptide repeat protein [Armatimonadaceae bacterium]
GGCGKSRLALEVARGVSPADYPDGAWLVELGSLAEPELVEETVASALGVPASAAARMAEALRDRRMLVVLDNCEHLLGAAAPLAERLLKACPHVRILATSREPFNVGVERTWRVPSLSLPDPRRSATATQVAQSAAVRFFAQRAQQRNPRFSLTDANAAVVAHICRRLDGIPLALELAAARVKALPVEQLSQRLDDQFRLLAGGDRTALPQHQTLRALMDWSFQLLNDPEKALLRRLSVFGGGCTLESAEVVCADGADGTVPEEAIEMWEVLDYLSQLVDKSLAIMEEFPADGGAYAPPRYRLMETVRAYAREKLREAGEEDEWRRRHGRYFRDVVLGAAAEGPPGGVAEQAEWQARLLADRDNLRVALDGLLAADGAAEPEAAEDAARVALGLIPFWARLGAHGEARGYLEKCLAREGEIGDAPRRAHLRRAVGWFSYLQGDHAAAESVLLEARSLYQEQGDAAGESSVLNHLALTAQAQGRLPEARENYGQCLQLARDAGEERRAGDALSNMGLLHIEEGTYAEARACLEEARAIFERMGDRMRTAGTLCNLSNLALKEGAWAEARAYSEESLGLFAEIDHRLGRVFSLINLTEAAAPLGDHAGALGYVRDALVLCQEVEMAQHVPLLLELAAVSQEATGDPEGALVSLGVAARLRREGAAANPAGDAVDAAEAADLAWRLEEALGPERAASARERAARTRPEEIFAVPSNP